MPPNRIVVTGGAGFLGAHLCKRLVEDGNYVFCVDDLSTGFKANIECLLPNSHFEFWKHDVTAPLPLGFVDVAINEIYNLACPASPIHYQANPLQTTKTCVLGALNLLSLADRSKGKILQASTSEIYGDPSTHPQPESYLGNVNSIGPRSCYDEGKRCAESIFFDHHRQFGTSIKVARIFNTYGPLMHPNDGRVVSNFICQAQKGEPLTIYGDGSQTRSLCFVDDMVEGLVRLMKSPHEFVGPVNLGNPEEITIKELARKVLKLQPMIKGGAEMIQKPIPKDDPKQRCPDISLAREKLNWEPKVSISAGLLYTVKHFRRLK